MKITDLDPIPANSNPFKHDFYHMGTTIGTNCMIMFEHASDEKQDYIIIIDTTTGEKKKITF